MAEDLFGFTRTTNDVTIENANQIKGLSVCFDFISKQEECELLKNIDQNKWLGKNANTRNGSKIRVLF
ncbi:MAG: hypothetical protein EBZ92_05055 [Actinobacteria bacterium]|nr:hypothetical protein [Actinomycetota bacterium]